MVRATNAIGLRIIDEHAGAAGHSADGEDDEETARQARVRSRLRCAFRAATVRERLRTRRNLHVKLEQTGNGCAAPHLRTGPRIDATDRDPHRREWVRHVAYSVTILS